MDLEYDQKFEEMKKYIPFLENMIKRLESSNNGGNNPRKAQLDKIRSLRDLLLDKKKRMKMENLLKCEQVLVNLYAKVEQRDASVEAKKDSTEKNQNVKTDLSLVRNKLKSVASKLHDEVEETLPEIARATNTEVVCTPGSKEPALFQRRPNKASLSPTQESTSITNDEIDDLSLSKRHYTRVLLSPEQKSKDWSPNSSTINDKPLFRRRSPRRSPRRYTSPSYKRERKKSSKHRSKSSQQSKDLNITLKVPEESLSSLNTKDILSRIINCSDSDVDIDTLRGLRSQILGELKQTGAKDDISDLILKSYKSKVKSKKKNVEVEEGEISDSESEAIENIYGSLVVVNKDDVNVNSSKEKTDNQQPRKIQICLVINSEKEKDNKINDQKPNDTFDITEFEPYTDEKSINENKSSPEKELDKTSLEKPKQETENKNISEEESTNKSDSKSEKLQDIPITLEKIKSKLESTKITNEKLLNPTQEKTITSINETFKPNFYQPLTEEKGKSEEPTVKDDSCKSNNESECDNVTKLIEIAKNIRASEKSSQNQVKKDVVSEIDILQALKKEILGETVSVPISDAITPPMHQPKVTKVSSSQEIVSKKRISIENYKQKSMPSVKQSLYTSEDYRRTSKDDNTKKQSLKLTEKECERFNLPPTLSQGDSSDDEDRSDISINDIYGNLAPKSPDHDDFADTGIKPPVIIPSDPIKNVVVCSKADIDMRTLIPVGSPAPFGPKKSMTSPLISSESMLDQLRSEGGNNNESTRKSVPDRIRTESTQNVANDNSSSYLTNFDMLPRQGVNYPNVTPDKSQSMSTSIPPLMSLKIPPSVNQNSSPSATTNMNPIMASIMNQNLPLQLNASMASNMSPILTANINPSMTMNPSMTPSRNPMMVPVVNQIMTPNPMMTPIMTPNARSYEMTPRNNFDSDEFTSNKHVYAPMYQSFESYEYLEKEPPKVPHWEGNENSKWEDRNLRNTPGQQDLDYQRHRNDRYKRGLDSPQIRMDCPPTPNPSFGRMETPMTPVHAFGRSDCPMTPSHSFGRSECPMTPSHSFGRSECPMTPSHPFGRSDSIMTPTNVFARDDYHNTSSQNYNKSQDPRLNRSSNHDKYISRNEERNHTYFNDNRNIPNNSSRYRRSKDSSYEQGGRNDRDRLSRQESSMGRSLLGDYDDYYNNDYRYRSEKSRGFDDSKSRRNYRARSIGRTNPSDDGFSPRGESEYSRITRDGSIEKPISVQSHSGRSFNIDTSFNRTFQDTKSPTRDSSFDARRQRASSVGRCLRGSSREDIDSPTTNINFKVAITELRSKAMNFRRACSVGRDVKDYNSERNLKDIKADLRSSKFDNYDAKIRNKEVKWKTSASFNAKSSQSYGNRDSRSRPRDNEIKLTKKFDSSKYSPKSNFRDPRVRREMNIHTSNKEKYNDKDRNEVSSHCKNYGIVYSNDNIAKGTILASAAGVKNFKIPKIKRPIEESEAESASKVKEFAAKETTTPKTERNIDNVSSSQIKKNENKETRSNSPTDKRCKKEKKKEQASTLEPKSKPDSTSLSRKEENIQSQLTESISSDSESISSLTENSERRITRSVVRREQMISNESNVKRLRRIKKPFAYDSDSDSQANETNENVRKNIEENKEMAVIRTKEREVKTVEVDMKENTYENICGNHNSNLNKNDGGSDEKESDTISNELEEQKNDALDISFGVDDELFSDNIASGSVLDNIKALIADLDNDIEAPKISDFNDKFINNIISSNDSPIPLDDNENNFVSDILISDKVSFDDDKISNHMLDIEKQNNNAAELPKDFSENKFSDLNKSENKLQTLDICEKKRNEKNDTSMTENSEKSDVQINRNESNRQFSGSSNNLNSDAIVTTTLFEKKSVEVQKEQHTLSSTHLESDSFFTPDSTFNLNDANNDTKKDNKDSQESIPDSTNEFTPEMNNDITSTHNTTDNLCTDISDAKTSSADDLPNSIGKLLSLLEDKNKIKELLTLLGKDSSENEKLKKKLEKLSEIVSDDEENTDSKHECRGKKKENRDISEDTSLLSSDKNESSVDNDRKNDENCHFTSKEEEDSSGKREIETAEHHKESTAENQKQSKDVQKKESVENGSELKAINKELEVSNILESNSVKCIDQNIEIGIGNALSQNITDVDVEGHVEISNQSSENHKDNEITQSTTVQTNSEGKPAKKCKIRKKGKFIKNITQDKEKRATRSNGGPSSPFITPVPKKPSRELLKLQEDIREMNICNDVLNSTGIRKCRLAKMFDEKNPKGDLQTTEIKPIVVLQKINGESSLDESLGGTENVNKKKNARVKPYTSSEASLESEGKGKPKYKPGPMSKTKKQGDDPYVFETDSVGESSYTVDSKEQNSDSDSDSGNSLKSFESTELLVELKKKPKRKRRGWQVGVIRKRNGRKNKLEGKDSDSITHEKLGALCEKNEQEKQTFNKPDLKCFTDKSYCFYKNIKNFMCRLCGYTGDDIVPHCKKQHPHSEIPLSRLNPVTAKEAIDQCENMNIQTINKIRTKKYVCRFCYKEFNNNSNTALEVFFWHVVSVHTGEYKQLCSECINITRCPFNLDIPPPPKNLKGQLIGYICGRCNFTQVSLENLKTHVIVRHDDEETEVYTINLSDISKKVLQSLIAKAAQETPTETPRVLRSTRSSQSVTEQSDDRSDIAESVGRVSLEALPNTLIKDANSSPTEASNNKMQSKFIFENDDMSDTSSYTKNDEIIKAGIKIERDDDNENLDSQFDDVEEHPPEEPQETVDSVSKQTETTPYSDVLDYPHFKIKLSGTGSKEYVCCINGKESHYKTTLLISLKKHVQKHSENWDGYCFVCKVIVMSQGVYKFKDCLQHFLDKHMDNFPVLEEVQEPVTQVTSEDEPKIVTDTSVKDTTASKSYINVRPLSELISLSEDSQSQEGTTSMPKIQSVVSLVVSTEHTSNGPEKYETKYKYEEPQAEIMSKKHSIVLETMLHAEKLIQIFKCAGRYCSYTTDNLEDALVHASTHQKIGGENSLKCAYCDFDAMGNAIDLVTHVFKTYSHCSYACSKCFYRASAAQLVHAHIKRIHTQFDADAVPVLSSTSIAKDNSVDTVMSRDQAVLYYVCNNRDPQDEGICQFRSFVLTKFREHMKIKHTNDQEYSCYICNISTPSSELLAQHLKSHGLRIYQCCRCIFGADNENELLAHASAQHPLKQPKAYLRITTSKGNSTEVRVLPLAVLTKSSVPTTIVTPSTDKDNPVRQAERSIDLEKLIGHTNLMIESIGTNAATIEPTDILVNEKQIQLESQETSGSNSPHREHSSTSPATLTLLTNPQNTANELTPLVKNEPVETLETAQEPTLSDQVVLPEPDVVCIDSDEDSRQNIIDLSYDDISTGLDQISDTNLKVPRYRLFKCRKCPQLYKTEATFKKHLSTCYPLKNLPITCAHCVYVGNSDNIINHYINVHSKYPKFICSLCKGTFINTVTAKRHMKVMHDEVAFSISPKEPQSGMVQYVLMVDNKNKERQVKRKMSGESASVSSEPAPKLTKYSPQDVDRLPINPILDNLVHCSLCEFSTKVRLNMVRHLQLHAEQQPVPRTAPVNPVPHLETNEKHFDKMVNLASSSATLRNDKAKDGTTAVTEHLTPEAASIYPKYVPERHRFTCGAKGCSYISVNESMFKFHWETLHNGTNDYHCVHCPPHQHLDTTRALTAARIIAHLKMHDTKLYACSSCSYYHHVRKLLDKHFKDVHKGKLVIVREDGSTVTPVAPITQPQPTPAPTMDLKPWQCGVCSFKSMLRPEVVEHCGKTHQSKMQFKCTYCGFRTSNIENISKHQSKQHPGRKEEVFYFYYREGSIPEDGGIPLWKKQSQRNEPGIKIESGVSPTTVTPSLPKDVPPKPPLNLEIVKKEPETDEPIEETIEDLCKVFGQFCEPNGLKYKCPLCKIVIEDSKDSMQSHLYEELQYRKWACGVCLYKAFHKTGLQQHVQTEHRYSREEPIELQVNVRIETWVTTLLEHQSTIIERNKENLAKQKVEILRANPGQSNAKEKTVEVRSQEVTEASKSDKPNVSMAELERLFGPFGVPNNLNYSCPKCSCSARSEAVMQEHLESELNKIRWCCNVCNETFQTYHEAQFHCRSVHQGQSSRPVEATRDVGLRNAWVAGVLRVQKLSMNYMPVTDTPTETTQPSDNAENSLLVVRYAEQVPIPEVQMRANRKSDSDDDALVIDEPPPPPKKTVETFSCSYCPATFKSERYYLWHVLKHYGLKPFTCPYCPYNDFRKQIEYHITSTHAGELIVYQTTSIPKMTPANYRNSVTKPPVEDSRSPIEGLVCFVCDKAMPRIELKEHFEDLGEKGDFVIKCCNCITVHKNVDALMLHHNQCHINSLLNYSQYTLHNGSTVNWCIPCSKKHAFLKDFKSHCKSKQSLKHTLPENTVIEIDDDDTGGKRKAEDSTILPVPKRVARKSTTKLPDAVFIAKKSTTKLPFNIPCEMEEYSYYGTKPNMDNLENVTTLMPFYNMMVPFSLKKLSEIIKIYPTVQVKDINK